MRTINSIATITLLFLGSGLPGCGDTQTPPSPETPSAATQPATATPSVASPAAPATPILTFTNQTIEFGDVADYETREARAAFTNTGTGPLQVTNVAPTCGCTTVGFDTSKIYAPGESGEIVLKFTPKGSGQQAKIVRIRSTDPKTPVQNVTIKANVLASLSAEPRVLISKRIPYRESSTQSTVITALRPGITITKAPMTGGLAKHVDTTIEPLGPDDQGRETWRVSVNFPDDLPWGWHAGNLTIQGEFVDDRGVTNPVKMNMAVNGNATGQLEPSMNMLRLGALTPGDQISRNITLSRRDGEPFEVIGDPTVEGGGLGVIRVAVTPVDPSKTVWRIEAKGAAPPRIGTIAGNILLQTDVPGEEVIALRYAGVVQQSSRPRP